MPVSVSVSSLEWVRHVVFSGTVTDRDLVAAYDSVMRCLLDPSMDLLVDATGVEKVVATPDTLKALASRRADAPAVAEPRVAVVAPNSAVLSVARTYGAIREAAGSVSRYFTCRTIAEARGWLGLIDEGGGAAIRVAHA